MLEELSTTCVTPLGEDCWELCLGSCRRGLLSLFPLLTLEPFSVINQSCEDNYMLSLLSLASKPLNLGVVLGTSGTIGMC